MTLNNRSGTAGVTLIEMLVVLALFAMVAGAVVLTLPSARSDTTAEAQARALMAHIDRALDLVLTTGTGFGLAHDGRVLRFVQPASGDGWGPHRDPQLAQVKLSLPSARISITAQEVFAVSAHLIPDANGPLTISLGTGARRQTVLFDGATVKRREGP